MRKEGPMILTVISSLVVVFSQYFFLGQKWSLMDPLNNWFQISYAIALALGFINLTAIHVKYIQRKREGWFYSIILLLSMYGYLALGMIQTQNGPQFEWIYGNAFSPLGSAMFSLVAFFITSAAYRAFRVRTKEATILLVCALFVMLGRAPIGDAIWGNWSAFVNKWVMGTMNVAGMRGINLGIYVGAFATALRIMLGLERAHIGGSGTQ
jgi:hypothetical protein